MRYIAFLRAINVGGHVEAGTDIRTIRLLLGHRRFETTPIARDHVVERPRLLEGNLMEKAERAHHDAD